MDSPAAGGLTGLSRHQVSHAVVALLHSNPTTNRLELVCERMRELSRNEMQCVIDRRYSDSVRREMWGSDVELRTGRCTVLAIASRCGAHC